MGCMLSQPPKVTSIAGSKRVTAKCSMCSAASTPQHDEKIDLQTKNYALLTSDVISIKCPPCMVPVVCLSEDSFPVILSDLLLDENEVTEIKIAIAAASCSDKGRIFCLSHVNFLSDSVFFAEDNSRLFYDVIVWLCRRNQISTPILLIGDSGIFKDSISYCFETQGIVVHRGNLESDFSKHQIIIISSDLDLSLPEHSRKFSDFLSQGGGLICLYSPPIDMNEVNIPINSFLLQYGLAYTYCTLNKHANNRMIVSIPSAFPMISFCHLIPLAEEFADMCKHEDIEAAQLDDLVTALRYHVLVCGEEQNNILNGIYQNAYSFLKRTNYNSQEGICPKVTHCIMAVLIQDLLSKIPVEFIAAAPEAKDFPGLYPQAEIATHELAVRLHDESWISTGLWLPAGHVGKIVSHTGTMSCITIQIGSHTESLLTRQGPWKRWPVVYSTFELAGEVTKVASQFGGIVYIAVQDLDQETEHRANLTFIGFARHPKAVLGKPEIWEQTKKFKAPWAEVHSKTLVFTMPTKDVERIEDIDKSLEHLDQIVTRVTQFMSYTMNRQYRIVFDLQLASNTIVSEYPIVMLIDDMEDIIFNNDKPTVALFKLVSCIALVSIREDYFDPMVEVAISNIVACIITNEFFPGFDQNIFKDYEFPPLFHELWIIHQHINSSLIKTLLSLSQAPDAPFYDSTEDMWIAFVKDISFIGKYNFTQLLERAKPIPLNLTKTLQELPLPPIRVIK